MRARGALAALSRLLLGPLSRLSVPPRAVSPPPRLPHTLRIVLPCVPLLFGRPPWHWLTVRLHGRPGPWQAGSPPGSRPVSSVPGLRSSAGAALPSKHVLSNSLSSPVSLLAFLPALSHLLYWTLAEPLEVCVCCRNLGDCRVPKRILSRRATGPSVDGRQGAQGQARAPGVLSARKACWVPQGEKRVVLHASAWPGREAGMGWNSFHEHREQEGREVALLTAAD